MGKDTKIQWADHTFNGWIGCQAVSRGCDHCYAEQQMDVRLGQVQWGPHGERRKTSQQNWNQPRKWALQDIGRRQRVFAFSLADVFDKKAIPQWRKDFWQLVRETPQLDWLVLTKRPEWYDEYLPDDWPLANVWLGISAEDQPNFDKRWAILRTFPAALRFISYEPALGPIRLPDKNDLHQPDWVIFGGESGPKNRPVDLDWARSMMHQCDERQVPFFMKQVDKVAGIPDDLQCFEFPEAA